MYEYIYVSRRQFIVPKTCIRCCMCKYVYMCTYKVDPLGNNMTQCTCSYLVVRLRNKIITWRELKSFLNVAIFIHFWTVIMCVCVCVCVCRSQWPRGLRSMLRPLACWDCGFESHRWHGYLSVVSVVCCGVEVSATSWSLIQRIPTDCGVWLCVI